MYTLNSEKPKKNIVEQRTQTLLIQDHTFIPTPFIRSTKAMIKRYVVFLWYKILKKKNP